MSNLGQCIVLVLLLLLPVVSAELKAYVELINGTPYDWELISNDAHHMKWSPNATIPSGTSSESCISWAKIRRDANAQATYRIKNPSSNESFTIRALDHPITRIEILYHENLSSLNNPEHSVIHLDHLNNHAHPFILAGNGIETPYISTNPPVAWMQSTYSVLSTKPLREISMPMSHDAGASIVTHSLNGPGTLHNTQTQSESIYRQLIFGARWLDIRPAFYKGKWMTYHGSFAVGSMWGATGQSIESVVEEVNRFTSENPGEMIVLDISHDANPKRRWKGVLSGVRDGWVDPGGLGWDLSAAPFGGFVGKGGRSEVLVRVPCTAPSSLVSGLGKRDTENTTLSTSSHGCDSVTSDDDLTPLNITEPLLFSQRDGDDTRNASDLPKSYISPLSHRSLPLSFTPIHDSRLPTTGKFSDTSSSNSLISSQLSSLSLHKSQNSAIHKLSWILTQPISVQANIGNWWTSILGYAVVAHRALYASFGDLVGGGVAGKPNLIEVDYIRSSDVAAFAMGLNAWE